jgi:hypothetical protein
MEPPAIGDTARGFNSAVRTEPSPALCTAGNAHASSIVQVSRT